MIVHLKKYDRNKQKQLVIVFFNPCLTKRQQEVIRKMAIALEIRFERMEKQLDKATITASGRDEMLVGQRLLTFLDKISKQLDLKQLQGR